jgi:hypothetical protein
MYCNTVNYEDNNSSRTGIPQNRIQMEVVMQNGDETSGSTKSSNSFTSHGTMNS